MSLINKALQPQTIISALIESANTSWEDGNLYSAREKAEQAQLFISSVREEHQAAYERLVSDYITHVQAGIDMAE